MPTYQEGVYDSVEVVGQGFTKSSKKGTPGFYLTIRPGEYDRTVTFWLPDGNEQSVDIMLNGLEAMGLDLSGLERFTQLDDRSQNHVSFVGSTVSVQCSYDNQGVKVYERWEAPNSGLRQMEQLDQPSIRKLDALFGKKLKGRSAKPATANGEKPAPRPEVGPGVSNAQRAAAQNAPDAQTDDIPFSLLWAIPFVGMLLQQLT